MSTVRAVLVGLFASLSAAVPALVHAQAAAYDVSGAVAELDNVGLTIAVIGVALVALAAIALAWRWIKAMFF